MRNFAWLVLVFAGIWACRPEGKAPEDPVAIYTAIFDAGDTLHSDSGMLQEATEVVFDSSQQYRLTLISTHEYVPNQSSTYFVRAIVDFQDKFRLLSELDAGGAVFKGPLISVFQYGDTIDPDGAPLSHLDWYPIQEVQAPNTGWFKYHIYTATQGSFLQNLPVGENYLVFKFGEPGNEHIGWLNVEYRDTLCYVKEGYYRSEPNQGVIVGKNE